MTARFWHNSYSRSIKTYEEISNLISSKASVKKDDNKISYTSIQDKDLVKKIPQLKEMVMKYKEKAEKLEKELAELKSN